MNGRAVTEKRQREHDAGDSERHPKREKGDDDDDEEMEIDEEEESAQHGPSSSKPGMSYPKSSYLLSASRFCKRLFPQPYSSRRHDSSARICRKK
jgi:hypothetical protein